MVYINLLELHDVCCKTLSFQKPIYTNSSQVKKITLPNYFTSFYGAELTVVAIDVSLKPLNKDGPRLCLNRLFHILLILGALD